MLKCKTKKLDGILYTHEHADHTAGLDDIRPFYFKQGKIDLFLTPFISILCTIGFSTIFINNVLWSPSASIDSNNSNSLNNSLSRRYSQQVRSSSASIDHKMNNSDRKKQRDENEKNLINNVYSLSLFS